MKQTKKDKLVQEKFDVTKSYSFEEGYELLKTLSSEKFDESVDICINLGIDPKKSEQMVRGACVLPNGTGRTVKVAVFAEGNSAKEASDAGADIVGFDDLYTTIESGTIDFDVLIATPESMKLVGKLGKTLGPKGLMPNPKVGTVTSDVKTAVQNAKSGSVQFRTEKAGIIHSVIGKMSFSSDKLQENMQRLLAELKKVKPASAKGIYIKKITLTSTMGPGLNLDLSLI